MKITIVCSYKDSEKLEIIKTPDKFCKEGVIYLLPNGEICLEDYAAKYKHEIYILKKRYAYLEKARNWILKNIRDEK